MFRDKPTTALFLLSLIVVVAVPAYLFLVLQPSYRRIVVGQANAESEFEQGTRMALTLPLDS
jgi:hypothetical protein